LLSPFRPVYRLENETDWFHSVRFTPRANKKGAKGRWYLYTTSVSDRSGVYIHDVQIPDSAKIYQIYACVSQHDNRSGNLAGDLMITGRVA
jgi:hypothetical protein